MHHAERGGYGASAGWCWALVFAVAAGCNSFAQSWPPTSPLDKPAATSTQGTGYPAGYPGLTPPSTAGAPTLDTAAPKTPPLPEPAHLDNKSMGEYLNDLAKGEGLEQSRQYDEARKQFQQLVEQWPGEYEAYHHLGQLCDRQKRYSEAQEYYQRAILLAGNREPAIFNDLGYSLFLQGKLDKAARAVRKAVALRPTEPKFHNNLGLIYGHQRRFEEAWNEFRRAAGEADAFYNLAFVKSSLNDFEGAKACFRRALAIDPTHERARRALKAFELADSDPDSLTLLETASDDGTEWVPYVENGSNPAVAALAGQAAGLPANRTSGTRPAKIDRAAPAPPNQ